MILPQLNTNTGASSVSPPQPIQYKNLYDNLKIPDAIKDLPKFDGNPNSLHEFITNVEEILQFIRGTDGTPYGQVLLRAIRNKIEGQANDILNMYGAQLIWDDIKNNLILHYADKRTETSLIRDLHDLRQGSTSVNEFYSEIIAIQSSLSNNLPLQEMDPSATKAKKDLFREMCLNAFLAGLREPLGSNIRAMRPETLAIAFSYCLEEQNIQYQKPNERYFSRKQNFRTYPNNHYVNQYTTQLKQQNFNRNFSTPNTHNSSHRNNTNYNNKPYYNNRSNYNNKPNFIYKPDFNKRQNFDNQNNNYNQRTPNFSQNNSTNRIEITIILNTNQWMLTHQAFPGTQQEQIKQFVVINSNQKLTI